MLNAVKNFIYSMFFCSSALISALAINECIPPEARMKTGLVLQIYDSDVPDTSLLKCLRYLPADELAHRHFAKIQYRHRAKMIVTNAEYDTLGLKLGDEVKFFPEDCEIGKISQINRILRQTK
ncbi:hypothetical protein GCM10011396_36480 [Undibacterium terreum]|uniref:Uncharacterized protein n=1 Tax=Undibacterium terreum TaxID=1224302 RepID=A0A916XMZ8_9BURK|nr:hypothetical protein GCM10011396_36480 [Undibacterium terreum]